MTDSRDDERTTCAVVGGGPAGIVLGLLLARGGVEVTVLEKHADFLRDFRGDTVHPSTMTLLDELGLWDRFAALPWRELDRFRVELDSGPVTLTDYTRLNQPHPFVAMVPQWHLLDMLASAGAEEPGFTLVPEAEVLDVVREGDRVAGVRYARDGVERVLRAEVVVAADGRDSTVRAVSGLPLRSFGVPMDVWWFRVPRGGADDPEGGLLRASGGRMTVLLDRGDYFQCAYLIPHGTDEHYRARPISLLHDQLRALYPWLGDRADGVASWDEVKLLAVTLDRLRRWSAPGLLCIGDAAHAMSPVGGVGINLAVQDAVAAARHLAPVLARPRPDPTEVDRAARWVQRRRLLPTVVTQGLQRVLHRRVIGSALAVETPATAPAPGSPSGASRAPLPMRLLQAVPALRRLPARLIGVGILPEHAPGFARRPSAPVGADAVADVGADAVDDVVGGDRR